MPDTRHFDEVALGTPWSRWLDDMVDAADDEWEAANAKLDPVRAVRKPSEQVGVVPAPRAGVQPQGEAG